MRSAVLLAAPLAAAVTKQNWAPGYRTAGNATTIHDGEAEETWAAYDHHYEAPAGWELQPFAYQKPDRYTGWYSERRIPDARLRYFHVELVPHAPRGAVGLLGARCAC